MTSSRDGTDRLFCIDQNGRIVVFPNRNDVASSEVRVFLDISPRVRRTNLEEGLLGLAFDPNYRTNGFFYVYYSATQGGHISRVSRFRVSTGDVNAADPASETILLEFAQPYSNHNGGMLAFGPDGMLYIGSGDGGSGDDPQNNSQNLGNLLGKILRIRSDGRIPADNPFVGVAGARGEIWAYGLRNPWRFSFDRQTGTLWAGDVGQNRFEEIDIVVKGGNYGWRVFEGNASHINPTGAPASQFHAPVLAYDRGGGRCVTGGYVYRGAAIPSLRGKYLYADFSSGRVWAATADGSGQLASNEALGFVTAPASFGEDEAGEVYIVNFQNGWIYGFEQNGAVPAGVEFPRWLSQTGIFSNTRALVAAAVVIEYDGNAPLWSDGARKRRWIALPGSTTIGFHDWANWSIPVGTVLVKHFDLPLSNGAIRMLETRVIVRNAQGWHAATYIWNDNASDAELFTGPAGSADRAFSVRNPAGGNRNVTWHFPSEEECFQCHTASFGRVLGLRTRQINRNFDYTIATDNQLRAWNHIGLFDGDIGAVSSYDALVDPSDATKSRTQRARSYLAANCAMCHIPGGPTQDNMDLRYGVSTDNLNIVEVVPWLGDLGIPDAVRLRPGSKETSVLWERMRRLDETRMPPLGSGVKDDNAISLIGDWIDNWGR